MELSRRQFLKVTGATLAGSSLALLGFSPATALAEVRQFKLAATTETRNTCPYCSVGCGMLMYSLGDGAKNAKPSIFHIEGDPDHPVNRGTLCPKGAGAGRLRQQPEPAEVSGVSRARLQRVEAHLLGRRARPHRQADEAGSRRQFRRDHAGRPDGEPLADHRHAGGLGEQQRSRLHHPQGRPQSRGMLAFDNQARV